MAEPGDTGFTSSTGPTKVEPKAKVDYEVNDKGEAVKRSELAAVTIGVRWRSVIQGQVLQSSVRCSGCAFWDKRHAPQQLRFTTAARADCSLNQIVCCRADSHKNKIAQNKFVFVAMVLQEQR